MAQTTAEKILAVLKTKLAEVSGVTAVVEGQTAAAALPEGTVQLLPMTAPREPAGGGKQRFHLGLLLTITGCEQTVTGSASRYGAMLNLVFAVLAKLRDAETAAALRGVGAPELRREGTAFWYSKAGQAGAPCGAICAVTIDFTL